MSVLEVIGKEIVLSTGKMPMVGMGCFFTLDIDPGNCQKWIEGAIDAGYRGFDTSCVLGVEDPLGKAIKNRIKSGLITRKDMFVTTKLSYDHHRPEDVKECIEESLKNLDLGYIDQYLIMWPIATEKASKPTRIIEELMSGKLAHYEDSDYVEVWKILEDYVRGGLLKSIGLSNFNARQVQEILDNCSIKPVVNQCEIHLYNQNEDLAKYCMERGVAMVAYTPLGNVNPGLSDTWQSPLKEPVVLKLAKKYKKTAGQIALRFTVQRGIPVIPCSKNPHRQTENLQLFDFELSSDDMEKLRKLERKQRFWKFEIISGHKDYPFHDPY